MSIYHYIVYYIYQFNLFILFNRGTIVIFFLAKFAFLCLSDRFKNFMCEAEFFEILEIYERVPFDRLLPSM